MSNKNDDTAKEKDASMTSNNDTPSLTEIKRKEGLLSSNEAVH